MFRVIAVCDDNKLGQVKRALAGLVVDLKDQPMVNVSKDANGKLKSETGGSALERFMHALARYKGKTVTRKELKELAGANHISPAYAPQLVNQLVELRVLTRKKRGEFLVAKKAGGK